MTRQDDVCADFVSESAASSITGNKYRPSRNRLPRAIWNPRRAWFSGEKKRSICAWEACCLAASVSISRPASWSSICQACRNRFAAARAETYSASTLAFGWGLVLAAANDENAEITRKRATFLRTVFHYARTKARVAGLSPFFGAGRARPREVRGMKAACSHWGGSFPE
jgi:hypothetical protein